MKNSSAQQANTSPPKEDQVLVVPPRSQQLKLALAYDDWALIEKGLIAFRLLAIKRDRSIEATGALELERAVSKIRAALLKEGHV